LTSGPLSGRASGHLGFRAQLPFPFLRPVRPPLIGDKLSRLSPPTRTRFEKKRFSLPPPRCSDLRWARSVPRTRGCSSPSPCTEKKQNHPQIPPSRCFTLGTFFKIWSLPLSPSTGPPDGYGSEDSAIRGTHPPPVFPPRLWTIPPVEPSISPVCLFLCFFVTGSILQPFPQFFLANTPF